VNLNFFLSLSTAILIADSSPLHVFLLNLGNPFSSLSIYTSFTVLLKYFALALLSFFQLQKTLSSLSQFVNLSG